MRTKKRYPWSACDRAEHPVQDGVVTEVSTPESRFFQVTLLDGQVLYLVPGRQCPGTLKIRERVKVQYRVTPGVCGLHYAWREGES